MKDAHDILSLIAHGNCQKAIELIEDMVTRQPNNDGLYYMLGKVYHKLGNWQRAIECYQEALARNPQSPARETLQLATDIMNFFNKDMYNQ